MISLEMNTATDAHGRLLRLSTECGAVTLEEKRNGQWCYLASGVLDPTQHVIWRNFDGAGRHHGMLEHGTAMMLQLRLNAGWKP